MIGVDDIRTHARVGWREYSAVGISIVQGSGRASHGLLKTADDIE